MEDPIVLGGAGGGRDRDHNNNDHRNSPADRLELNINGTTVVLCIDIVLNYFRGRYLPTEVVYLIGSCCSSYTALHKTEWRMEAFSNGQAHFFQTMTFQYNDYLEYSPSWVCGLCGRCVLLDGQLRLVAYGPSEAAPYGHPNLPGVSVTRARGVQVFGPISKSYEPEGPATVNQDGGAPINFVIPTRIIVQNQGPAPVVVPPGAFYPPPPPAGPLPLRVNRVKVEPASEDKDDE